MKAVSFLAFALLVLAADAKAGDAWLNFGFVSHHTEEGLNENNYGIGIEKGLTSTMAVAAGSYRNSQDRHSAYAGVVWMPVKYRDIAWAGVVVGGVTGYAKADYLPMLLPAIGIELGRVGVNLLVIPEFSHVKSGAAALQFKVKL